MAAYDNVAQAYSDSMSEEGDYFHKTQIDPYIYKAIGDPNGKIIYDLGCGNGYIARSLAQKGAQVYASDISPELVKIAKELSKGLDITYSTHEAADFSTYPNDFFDVVIMNMVIHYIKDLDTLFKGMSRVLKPGGILIFSTNHPFRPAYPYSKWEVGKIDNQETLFIKVTGYLKEEERNGVCWCDNKTKLEMYNQPLHTLVNSMSQHRLLTCHIDEPLGEGFARDYGEELQKSHYIPTFIVITAQKVA